MYDVIVVGAGPAGASAARKCAQLGLSTLLIDKAVFPRNKPCGGALSEQAISYLDFDLPGELIEQNIYGTRVHFGETFIEVKKSYRVAVTVSRSHFDHFLLKKAEEAGAKVVEGRRVSKLDQNRNCVQVIAGKDKYCGRIIIGSDGFHSVVARYVRRRHHKHEYGNCIELKVPAADVTKDTYTRDVVDIYFGVAGGGYGWVFPHKGCFSIGIGAPANQLVSLKTVMHDFLASTGALANIKMRGSSIPAGGVHRNVTADRLLLTGDAAGFVDTFLGEGIAYAIRSGQLAGEAATTALKRGSCCKQGLHAYKMRCEHEFGKDLQYSLHFSRIMHKFPNLFLRLVASEPEVADKYLEVLARQWSYRKYLAWLLLRVPYFMARLGITKATELAKKDFRMVQ